MSPELPQEIWDFIASFLSDKHLWQIRELNRWLWDAAWNRQCKLVYLDAEKLQSKAYMWNARRLRNPMVATRVRELAFGNGEHHASLITDTLLAASDRGYRETLKSHLQDIYIWKPGPLKEIVKSFENLRSIRVSAIQSHDAAGQISPLDSSIHSLIGMVSSTLRSLTIAVLPFANITTLLTHTHLPQLEHFSITFSSLTGDNTGALFQSTLQATVIPFLDRHRASIISLEVISTALAIEYDITSIFSNLQAFPHLQSLTFSPTSTKEADARSLRHFLSKHSACLQSLTLLIPHDSRPGGESSITTLLPLMNAPLPHLRKMVIEMRRVREPKIPLPYLTDFIRVYAAHLTQLQIRQRVLTTDDWRVFSTMNWAQLRYLNLHLYILTPEVINVLSMKFPNLETLELEVVLVVSSWSKEISSEDNLNQIGIVKQRKNRLTCLTVHGRYTRPEIIRDIVDAFPHLVLINGMPRRDVEDQATQDLLGQTGDRRQGDELSTPHALSDSGL
ncbi:hypothetical protein CPB83DRAFT_864202 [Crepidotus variabilis]|uniref:Uncharacterized protein n=1 Tax=Crepidotus variabilis TaxID=179855 RepID=A0A9P6E4Y0_9AGAR|nr:hypothetical protein CPB83DRAFT_864202 [Crepidotus variabilis]